MNCVYSGFDKLEITFQGCLLTSEVEALAAAKEKAQETRNEQFLELGPGSVPVLVHETGIPHFSFRVDTGPDQEIWFFSKSVNEANWGIRVSVRAMSLALYGYEACKVRVFDRLKEFGAIVKDHRVARVDYALDFHWPEFEIDLARFSMHHSMGCSAYFQTDSLELCKEDCNDLYVSFANRKPSSVRIGRSAGYQIAIYNKRREVLQKRLQKAFWWEIWELKPASKTSVVWRLELRAGKECLRSFNVDRLEDLEAAAGNLFRFMLRKVQYKAPDQSDTNRTRQKRDELWTQADRLLADIFSHWSIPVKPEKIIRMHRLELRAHVEAGVRSAGKTIAIVDGIPAENPERIAVRLASIVRREAEETPDQFQRKFEEKKARYQFLDPARFKKESG